MARNTDVLLDAPIPGMSLTAEFGARPWQTPPDISSIDDTIEYYLERMSTDEFADQLIDVIEMGVPLSDVANTLQLAAVMEGVHTIDVGILVLPLLVEMMMLIGDSAGVDYDSGLEDNPNKDEVRKTLLQKTIRKFETKIDKADKEEKNKDPIPQKDIEEEPLAGLMSRRQ
tara:strand:- start:2669 stop:3181 length:513 start_codon:yes stop_codon:yes gene_type:complete